MNCLWLNGFLDTVCCRPAASLRERAENNNENFNGGNTKDSFCLRSERKKWKQGRERERERGERRQSAHLEHDPVLFLRLLNHTHVAPHCDFWHGAGLCRFTTAPGLTTSYTRTLSNKVFVCGSGRAPPSFAGVVVYCTASPQSNTQHIPARGRIYSLYGCVTVLLLLAHNSSDIIQRKLQCGDSFRAARMNVCFCLHCRHTHTKKESWIWRKDVFKSPAGLCLCH